MLDEHRRYLLATLAILTASVTSVANHFFGAERVDAAVSLGAVLLSASIGPRMRIRPQELFAVYLTLSWLTLTTVFVVPPDDAATVPTWLHLALRFLMWRSALCTDSMSSPACTLPLLVAAIPEDVFALRAWPVDHAQGCDALVAVSADMALAFHLAVRSVRRGFGPAAK